LYPLAGAIAGLLMPEVMALQLISLASFAAAIFLMERIIQWMHPEAKASAALFTLLFFALSPFMSRYSTTVMSDIPALSLALACCYFTLRYLETKRPFLFFLVMLFFFLAVNTRFAVAMILPVPLFFAFRSFFRKFHPGWFLMSVLAGMVVFAPNFLPGLNDPAAMQGQYGAVVWKPMNLFSRTFHNLDGLSAYHFPNILFVFSNLVNPGFIFPGVVFLGLLFVGKEKKWWYLPWITAYLVYALFIGGFSLQNDRYLLLSFPLVLVLFFEPWQAMAARIPSRWLPLVAVAVMLVQAGLVVRAILPFRENCRVTREVTKEVGRYPEKKVYEFNMAMAFPAYGVTNPSENLWSRQIECFDTGALVVFNLQETAPRWQGLNPMLNWERLNTDYRLKELRTFDKGWRIYEIGR
jgi:hypothetical protein